MTKESRFPLHRPVVGAEELAAVEAVLSSGQLSAGPRVEAFESAVAELLGFEHSAACSSGTASLHLAMLARGCGRGDRVIVPAFGFPATANVVELCGAEARPADVDPETFALTAETVEARADERVVGLAVVHPFGIPAPMEELEALAARRGWWIVEDAACALGTAPAGRWARGGNPVCLSFHPRKTVTTGEGGMVLTRDPGFAAKVRPWLNHGIGGGQESGGLDRWRRFGALGMNYRLSDVHAAIGLAQLGRLEAIVTERRRVVAAYREALRVVGQVRVPTGYDLPELSCQSFVVVLDDGIDRDALVDWLAARGVETTLGGYGLTEQPYYDERHSDDVGAFEVAGRLFRQSLTLPVTVSMDVADVREVASLLAAGIEENARE